MGNANFVLIRDKSKDVSGGESFTPGEMFFNGLHFCWTCEDLDRQLENGGVKVKSRTAIGRGKYRLIVTFSNRFQKPLPLLMSVPGFSGVRIHGGNKAEDSEGCILVGGIKTPTGVAKCAPQVQRIIEIIEATEDQGFEAWLEIK